MAVDPPNPPRPPLLPLPEGVSEVTGLPVDGGIVEATDGRLVLVHADRTAAAGLVRRFSGDGGRTWTQGPEELVWGIFGWFDVVGERVFVRYSPTH